MVYCSECGAKNEDDAKVCVKCGKPLYQPRVERRGFPEECFGEVERECFGLPYGGAIVGIIFGTLIILIGLAIYFGVDVWRVFWPAAVVIIGILIIVGSLYGLTRRRRPSPAKFT